LAVTADVFSGGTLTTHSATLGEVNYTFASDDPGITTLGDVRAYSPLLYSAEDGWETTVYVQNRNKTLDAKVRVDFFDSAGQILHTMTGFVPPGSVSGFRREIPETDPGDPAGFGFVRVSSEDYFQEGSPQVEALNLSAVVHQIRRNDTGCILESTVHDARPEREVLLRNGLSDTSQSLTLPSVFKGFGPLEITSDIVVSNVNPNPGSYTAEKVTFYGSGFSTDVTPFVLDPKESFLVSPGGIPGVPPGFSGSLVIDASSDQTSGPSFQALTLHRANALLPNALCNAAEGTETPTPSATSTSTPGQTSTPTPTPTNTQGGNPSLTADVSVSKSLLSGAVLPGNTVVYAVTATNNGPDTATNVVMTDYLPAGTAFLSGTPGCVDSGGVVTCNAGNLADGNVFSVTIEVQIGMNTTGTVTNFALAVSDTADPDPSNNSTILDTDIAAGSPTPTITPGGPTLTPTPTSLGDGNRADINQDGDVDSEDQLLLLQFWHQMVKKEQ